jgi:hypothetical protein
MTTKRNPPAVRLGDSNSKTVTSVTVSTLRALDDYRDELAEVQRDINRTASQFWALAFPPRSDSPESFGDAQQVSASLFMAIEAIDTAKRKLRRAEEYVRFLVEEGDYE